jgi:hypothetical protein
MEKADEMTTDADGPKLPTLPEMPSMWDAVEAFHDRLDWTEPWARELAIDDADFGFVADAVVATLVSIELLRVLEDGWKTRFVRTLLDGRVVQSVKAIRTPGERAPEWTEERRRLAREAVFDVWREADDVIDELERAVDAVVGDPDFDPGWRPAVRAMIAVKSSVSALALLVWNAFEDVALEWSERPSAGLPVGDIEVLALSERTAAGLRTAGFTIDELQAASEDEMVLPDTDQAMLDEIADRMVVTGFILPEHREKLFHVSVVDVPGDDRSGCSV